MAHQQSSNASLIHPVRHTRIYSEIVDRILSLIKNRDVGVGDRLPSERQLAQQFNVSRSALREAMTALEVLGVIEIRPGVGIFIGPNQRTDDGVVAQVSDLISEDGPLEILEARAMFEPSVARVAAGRRTDVDLSTMDGMIREMEGDNGAVGARAGSPTGAFTRRSPPPPIIRSSNSFSIRSASACRTACGSSCVRTISRRRIVASATLRITGPSSRPSASATATLPSARCTRTSG